MTYTHLSKVLLMGKESSWGAGGTADKDVGLYGLDIQSNLTKEIVESMTIGELEPQEINAVMKEGKLSITGEFQHGRLLELVFGTVSHAETTGDWKHTFTVGGNPSAVFESGLNSSNDVGMTFTGMVCESAEISIALNDVLKARYDFRGKFPTPDTSTSTMIKSSLPVFPHSKVSVEINGTTPSELQEATISITREVKFTDGVGSDQHQNGAVTAFKVNWSCKVGFDDYTYHNLIAGGSDFDFKLNANNGVTLGSGRRELSITVDTYELTELNEIASVGELVFVELKGQGVISEAFSVDNISDTAW